MNKKAVLLFIGIWGLHLILTGGALLLAYSHTMYDFARQNLLTRSAVVFTRSAEFLMSPIVPLQQAYLPTTFSGYWAYLPIMFNSLIWTAFIWSLAMGLWLRRQNQQATD